MQPSSVVNELRSFQLMLFMKMNAGIEIMREHPLSRKCATHIAGRLQGWICAFLDVKGAKLLAGGLWRKNSSALMSDLRR